MDKPRYEFAFLGQLHWKYRWQHIWFAMKTLWMALHGYHLSVISND